MSLELLNASKHVKNTWNLTKIVIIQIKWPKNRIYIPLWRDGCYSTSLLCSLMFLELLNASKHMKNAWNLTKIAIIQHKMTKKSILHTFWRDGCHRTSLLCSFVSLGLLNAFKHVKNAWNLTKISIIQHKMTKKANLHTILEGWLS